MTNVALRNFAILAAGAFFAGCSANIPQAEKTYTASLNAEEEAHLRNKGFFLTEAEARKLEEIERDRLKEAIDLKILGRSPETPSPVVGFGFAAETEDSFVINRDGSLRIFSPEGEETPFDAVAGRLDRAIVDSGRVIAASPRGTMLALDERNLAQQTVLRPQTSTFNQVHVYDFATVAETSFVAAAAEGGQLEFWDMASGNLVDTAKFESVQPRSLLEGCPMDEMVFGTNEGQVRRWNKKDGSTVFYSHDGPVLDIAEVPGRNLLISTAKDGTVVLYDRTANEIVKQIEFDTAVYQLHVSPDERYAVAVPALGEPYRIDLESFDGASLALSSGNTVTKGSFLRGGQWFIAQQGAEKIYIWDMRPAVAIEEIAREHNGGILDYAVSEKHDLLVIATPENKIDYWDLSKRRYAASPLQTEEDILGVALSDRGDRALAVLVNGRLVSWKVHNGVSKALVLNEDDFSG